MCVRVHVCACVCLYTVNGWTLRNRSLLQPSNKVARSRTLTLTLTLTLKQTNKQTNKQTKRNKTKSKSTITTTHQNGYHFDDNNNIEVGSNRSLSLLVILTRFTSLIG